MSNVHIHLHVSDLETSRRFYERFLGAEPAKVRPGYVKFLPSLAPINLALSAGEAGAGKTVDHLGFQVETRDAVASLAPAREVDRDRRSRGDGKRLRATRTRTSSGFEILTGSSGRSIT